MTIPRLPDWRAVPRYCRPTLVYWMETEVHVYGLAVAASVMLSFFPFLIVIASLCRWVLKWPAATAAIYMALDDFFPGELGKFVVSNLRVVVGDRGPLQVASILLLLFTANGIFEPLEVALNRVWGVTGNRSFLRNQAVSTALIFGCGTLALLSTLFTGMNPQLFRSLFGEHWPWVEVLGIVAFKVTAVPLSILMLFLIYWRLPNRPIEPRQVVWTAAAVGLVLEAMKYLNLLTWPLWRDKLRGEYGPFAYSVTIILWSFLGAMVMLAGAEWAARREAARAASVSPPESTASPGRTPDERPECTTHQP